MAYFIKATPSSVAENATSLLVFHGPPNSAIIWSLTGNGSLTDAKAYTDSRGRASAKYHPGDAGNKPVVTVQYGA